MNYKVSVVLPTYNRGKVVKNAVDSLLIQSQKIFEIIVVDDASTDNTREVLDIYISSERIKYYYLNENGGQCNARNIGVQHATGDYIAYLDSDNFLYYNWLELMLKFLNKNKWCKWLYPRLNRKFILPQGTLLIPPFEGGWNHLANINLLWTQSFEADPNGLIISREIVESGVQWDVDLKTYTDYDYAIQISRTYSQNFGIHPHVLGYYERTYISDSVSADNTHGRLAENLNKILTKNKDFIEFKAVHKLDKKVERYRRYDKDGIKITDRVWDIFKDC